MKTVAVTVRKEYHLQVIVVLRFGNRKSFYLSVIPLAIWQGKKETKILTAPPPTPHPKFKKKKEIIDFSLTFTEH